jgi:hypothetical protein
MRYPPTSTEEGYDGLFGIAVFSQCINAKQNTRGGNQLKALYGQKVKEIPVGTIFSVRATGIDCGTVAPAGPGPPK